MKRFLEIRSLPGPQQARALELLRRRGAIGSAEEAKAVAKRQRARGIEEREDFDEDSVSQPTENGGEESGTG